MIKKAQFLEAPICYYCDISKVQKQLENENIIDYSALGMLLPENECPICMKSICSKHTNYYFHDELKSIFPEVINKLFCEKCLSSSDTHLEPEFIEFWAKIKSYVNDLSNYELSSFAFEYFVIRLQKFKFENVPLEFGEENLRHWIYIELMNTSRKIQHKTKGDNYAINI